MIVAYPIKQFNILVEDSFGFIQALNKAGFSNRLFEKPTFYFQKPLQSQGVAILHFGEFCCKTSEIQQYFLLHDPI